MAAECACEFIKTGTLITSFIGPIPCGCMIVSKTWIGVENGNFGVGDIFSDVCVGYTNEC